MDPAARQLAIAALQRFLADLQTQGITLAGRGTVPACDGRHEVYLCVGPCGDPARTPDARPDSVRTDGLSDREEAVLEVLASLPEGQCLSGPRIAERAGYPYQAALRACLASLRRRGLIEHVTGAGYQRTRG